MLMRLFRNEICCCTGLAFFLISSLLYAEETPSVHARIIATLDEENHTLTGKISLTITNDTAFDLAAIPLSFYPNHLREPSSKLDGGQVRWIYPKGRSAGGMEISGIRWNGKEIEKRRITFPPPIPYAARKEKTVARIALPTQFNADETGILELDFKVLIPIRRGRFGTYRKTTVLAGGWFPRPMTELTGFDATLPPERIQMDVQISIPPGRGAVLHDRIFPKKKSAQSIAAHGIVSEALVLVVMEQMEITTRQTQFGEAIHVHQNLSYRDTPWKETTVDHNGFPNGLPDPGRLDYSGRILDVVENTGRLIRERAPECPISRRIVLVDIPAWDRMVHFGPGPVLVSDRLYRLLPVDDGLFFHDLALVRVVAPTLVFSALAGESPEYRFVAADTIGVYFSDRYSLTIHDKRRTVREIINWASMFPAVDALLYAPQIPFKEVYFKPIEEPDPLRDEPWYYTNHYPRGKRLAGKLEDLVGREKVGEAVAQILNGNVSFKEGVTSVIPGDAAFFFDQWYGTYPKVNYRIGNVNEIPLPDGRIEHRFEVVREGAVIREPVTILVTDDDGNSHEMVCDNDRRKETLSWISNAGVDDIIIDPKGRLVETPELTLDHPLSDNSNKLPLRPPMFTRLVVWADVTSKEPYIELGFWLRRKYDTTNVINLDLDYTPSTYGALLSYYRFFGKKRTLNARTWGIAPSLSVVRYNAVDNLTLKISDSARAAATMGSIGLTLGRNTKIYSYDPITGSSFSIGCRYATGRAEEGDIRHVGKISVNGGKIFAPGIHHTLALYGGATAVFGEPVAANLTSLSDRAMLRGFDSDETYGRLGLYGVLEYRHTLVNASTIRAPIFSWFDRFQGALFIAGGTISQPQEELTKGLFTRDRIFTEVGYGLRIHLLFLGIQQYIIAVDVAVPITPTNRRRGVLQSDGTIEEVARRPYKVIVGITQTF
jgi:hypothetical protein